MADLKKFVEWCRKGPDQAVVTEVVELSNVADHAQFMGFAMVR